MSKNAVPGKPFSFRSSAAEKEAEWASISAKLDERALAHAPRGARSRSARFATAAVALGMAAASVLVFRHPTSRMARNAEDFALGPLRLQGGAAVGDACFAASGRSTVVLDDGSSLLLVASPKLRVLANDAQQFAVEQRAGVVHYKVTPGGPRHWSIAAPLARIEVVGTEFTVDVSDAQLTVNVDHGIVRVLGERVPGFERRLTAGDSLVVRVNDTDAKPNSAPALPRLADGAPKSAPHTSVVNDDAPDDAQAATFLLRARADELWALADVSRHAGRPGDAVPALERLVRVYPGDSRAPLAAFTLGRIYQDSLHAAPDAERSFVQALQLGLPPNLVQDARVHLVELRCKEPESGRCDQERDAFEREFPASAERVRAWTAP